MEEIKSNAMDDDKPKGMSGERKIMLGLVAALLIVAVYMYGWKVSAVDAVENKLSQVETEQAEPRHNLVNEAKQLNDRRAEDTLRLFSIPFAWAIRRELMRRTWTRWINISVNWCRSKALDPQSSLGRMAK